jgi:hypothetical protein
MKGKRTKIFAVGLAILLLLSARGHSSTVVFFTHQELAEKAESIVHGVCIDKQSYMHEDGYRVVTEYRFQVHEMLKGTANGSEFVFRQFGGVVGNIGYYVPGAATFTPNEEVLTFVGKPGRRSGCAFTVGLAQGKFSVRRDGATGRKILFRKLSGLRVRAPGSSDPMDTAALKGKKLFLDDFLVKIRGYVKK